MTASGQGVTNSPIPARAGVGLRHPHVGNFVEARQPVGWIEVHSENYLCPGGPRIDALEAIRRDLPLSCHGVGLSLGSHDGLDENHLQRLRGLFDRFEPGLVSEHVSWSVADGVYLNDLLPLPYTEEALDVLCRNIDHAQDALGRRVLIENPSSYVSFSHSTLTEWDFIAAASRRTGCGLLLDVNNIYVSAHNHGYSIDDYLAGTPGEAVEEIHIAGHAVDEADGREVRIDDHGHPVIDPVWDLLDRVLAQFGPKPVLVERDLNIPPLGELLAEVATAERALDRVAAETAHVA